MKRRPARRRDGGLSLVEVLVALALSLGLLLAGTTLVIGAQRAASVQVDASGVDDGGRFALALIGRAVRLAGSLDWEKPGAGALPAAAPAPLAGFDSRTLAKTTHAIDAPLAGSVHGSDVLAVQFMGAGPGPDGDGSVLDCAGFAIPAGAVGWSIFYVARSSDGQAELRCKYRGKAGWGADAIVAGVDAFQVLYGLDSDTPPDGIPNRYVNASTLAALDAALPLTATGAAARAAELNARTWWKRVASVQVALLLRAPRPGPAAHGRPRYALFGAAYSAHAGASDPGVALEPDDLEDKGAPPARRLLSAVFAPGAPAP